MVRPIPKRLLIHSAVLSDVSMDAFQSESLTTAAELQHIRIEPSTKQVTTRDNRQINLSAVLFYCCRNSRPAAVPFYVGQRITFGGAVFRVETVDPIYDDSALHHYELGLV